MDDFVILLARQAHRDLDQLPLKFQRQIAKDLKTLTRQPFPSGIRIKKLKGFGFPLYRLRAGDYRALYRIDGQRITIMRVIDRKMLELVLKRLKLL